jgi:hypothetical protein
MFKSLPKYFFPICASLLALTFLFAVQANAQSISDFSIIKAKDIGELLRDITSFLVSLAPALAGLVIIWGGYQYFLGGFDQKADGLKAIKAAVIGLALVFSYSLIVKLVTDTLQPGASGGFNTDALIAFITSIGGSLVALSSIFAIAVIIYGGYKYMFSSLPGAKGDGKAAIQNGIIGLAAILLAQPIIDLVKNTVDATAGAASPINTNAIAGFLLSIINGFLIPISSIVTVFFFVLGGFNMLTSGGDSGKYKKGQEYLKNAVIGLIVVLTAFTLTQIVIFIVQRFSFS